MTYCFFHALISSKAQQKICVREISSSRRYETKDRRQSSPTIQILGLMCSLLRSFWLIININKRWFRRVGTKSSLFVATNQLRRSFVDRRSVSVIVQTSHIVPDDCVFNLTNRFVKVLVMVSRRSSSRRLTIEFKSPFRGEFVNP